MLGNSREELWEDDRTIQPQDLWRAIEKEALGEGIEIAPVEQIPMISALCPSLDTVQKVSSFPYLKGLRPCSVVQKFAFPVSRTAKVRDLIPMLSTR